MKKMGMLLVLCMSLVFCLPVSAAEPALSKAENGKTMVVTNEYDAYVQMKGLSDKELKKEGLTTNQIEKVRSVTYEEALLEMAQLPEETLMGYGYTKSEVAVLKQYNGEPITKKSEVYAVLPTCSADLYYSSATTRSFVLHYDWSWNKVPVFAGTDSATIRWSAYDYKAIPIDVTQSNVYTILNYYTSAGVKSSTVTARYPTNSSFFESHADFNAIQCKFNMLKSSTWVKSGSLWLTISLDSTVNNSISYIKVKGCYGHSIVSGTPSVSFSGTGASIDFSFSGSTQDLCPVKYKISSDGTKVIL